MRTSFFLFLILLVLSCSSSSEAENTAPAKKLQGVSLLGDSLISAPPGTDLSSRYEEKKAAFLADQGSVDKLIWYGRFTAYMGNYQEAIDIYSAGIQQFPDDARLYRHRGHRHLTIRQFDQAISDFEKAVELIQGTENEIEPDGMPNAQNIPVSTLHGNIYYHLGLAYYLRQDMEKALAAYQNCLASSGNTDNLVSSTHWLYMISRRLGRNQEAEAYLKPISTELEVIENTAYHRACLFYKGLLDETDLLDSEGEAPANDALAYALANWSFYNGDLSTAKERYEALLEHTSWNSFGYLAAESDYYHHFLN